MIYRWELRDCQATVVYDSGNVEADSQSEAMRMLNEDMDISPHTNEVLEIIAQDENTEGADSEIAL